MKRIVPLLRFPFTPSVAKRQVEYTLSFENAAHHEIEITVQFMQVPDGVLKEPSASHF